MDVSVWLFDVYPACCVAREFIYSTSDGYDATDMARIDETRERAATGERGLLVDMLPLTNLHAYSHSDVPFSFILQSCNFSFKENRAAIVLVDARVKLYANHVLLASERRRQVLGKERGLAIFFTERSPTKQQFSSRTALYYYYIK